MCTEGTVVDTVQQIQTFWAGVGGWGGGGPPCNDNLPSAARPNCFRRG